MASEENNVAAETKEVTESAPETKTETKEASEQPAAPAAESQPPKPVVRKTNYEKDIVYLYQFSRTPVVPSLSPYCLKVETWLRLAGLKYENVDHKMKYRSKKGQLPFVEINGEEIADSSVIIKELSQQFTKDLDITLDNNQKNISHAMISMIENHLFWVVMWWRTKQADNIIKGYKVNLQHALGTRIPNGILNFFFKFSYGRKVCDDGLKKVKAQGIGVHKPEEIVEFGKQDLKVLSDLLADKPFFFGDEPTTLDVVAFANLAQIYFVDKEVSFPLQDYMQESCANLVGLVNRMKDKCFPDWEDICTTLDLNSHLPKPPPEEKDKEKDKGKDEEKKAEKDGDDKDKENEKSEKEIEKENEKDKETDENKDKEIKKEKEDK
ncbi:failed axon connections-like isoform X1 [Macrosteles quadrilineatus]|uniref:failed axon connections-like isoform X1 n=1 Tax=Macrosteles quadrilineatus TaxID=74068 RepID=UPI0023E1C5A1|nr:failed axon connections-like isoform X1 [Macrosteles quadrilineatus]